MGPLDALKHLFSFLAPAAAVALVLAVAGPFLMPKRAGAQVFIAQVAMNFIAGAVALSAGLWYFGNDGKMATYGLMLVLCSAAQASSGVWRK